MKPTVFERILPVTVSLISGMENIGTTHEIANYTRKLGDTIGDELFSSLLNPYFDASSINCLHPDEDVGYGRQFLHFTDTFGLEAFCAFYEKALIMAEKGVEGTRKFTNVRAELDIFAPREGDVETIARLQITFGRDSGGISPNYVSPHTHTFYYSMLLEHGDKMVDCPQMPDIEERSIASPVYLVNAQNVKATFGHTVKEHPVGIYLCARRYGWSEVAFHGQQVLLKADIHVR